MIDKGTIGSMKCEISLNNILIMLEKLEKKLSPEQRGFKNILRRVMNLYYKFRKGLKHLREINDIDFHNSMVILFKDDIINKIERNRKKYENILGEKNTTLLLSHLRCCIIAYFREALRYEN